MKITTGDFFQDQLLNRPLRLTEYVPYLVLPACVLFNFFLCYVNTRLFTISIPMIVMCEILLVGISTFYGFFSINKAKLYWLAVLVLQLCLMLMLSLARDEFLIKPIRDMIIMPVFVVLGLASARIKPVPLLFAMCALLAVVAMWEAYFLETFLSYFNIRRYYVEKGVLGDDYFIPLDLAASGLRPGERFLMDLPFHRLSSVFLEPVSLGFFGFISGLFFVAVKKNISFWTFMAGLALAYFLIIVSDARMAFGTLTLVILLRRVFAYLDHRFAALVFPTIFLLSLIIYVTEIFGTTGDGLGWRISDTMEKLSAMNFDLFTGLSTYNYHAEDSALLKIFQYQGFLGLLIFWLAPIFFVKRLPEEPKIYLFGITIFLTFGFMISSAILTIKTASFLWFLYGYLIAWTAKRDQETIQDNDEVALLQADITGRSP